MKTSKLSSMLTALVMVVIGIIFLVHPGNVLISILRILGIGLMLTGLIGAIGYFRHRSEKNLHDLLIAVIEIVAAGVILAHKGFAISIYPVIVGIMLILDGVRNLLDAFAMKKDRNNSWKIPLALAAVTLVLGLVILLNPFTTAEVLTAITGIALIYEGIANLIITFKSN